MKAPKSKVATQGSSLWSLSSHEAQLRELVDTPALSVPGGDVHIKQMERGTLPLVEQ